MSAPASLNRRAICTASSGVMPPSTQSWAEIRTLIGLSCRPHGAHRANTRSGIAAAVFQTAAVFVGALVGQRRNEGRQQVAVRAVQFQPVEAGLVAASGGAHEVGLDAVHVRHVASRASCDTPSRYCCGEADTSGQLPSASGWSMPSHMRAGRALGAGVAELHGDLGVAVACTKSTMRFHAAVCSGAYMPGQAGRDARVGRHAGHLGEHQPAPPIARRRGAPGGSRPPRRRRPNTAPSARPRCGSSAPCRAAERREHRRHARIVRRRGSPACFEGALRDPVLEAAT
jgi:hypothetical protein